MLIVAILHLLAFAVYIVEGGRRVTGRERDLWDNVELDDPTARCRNGGVFANGRCHCIHPHTGASCQDFACAHGISVGTRYDPRKLFFNRPCICNDGWAGDLCEYHLSEKCSNRGEWKNQRCNCIGSFFGPTCQFTSRCDMGTLHFGRCICDDHWVGEYCHRIRCNHGSADVNNRSQSCICPKNYAGEFCNKCADLGYPTEPYPNCKKLTSPRKPKPPVHTEETNYNRFLLLGAVFAALIIMSATMMQLRRLYMKRVNLRDRSMREFELRERKILLEEAAMKSATNINENTEDRPKTNRTSLRKGSLANAFRWINRHSST